MYAHAMTGHWGPGHRVSQWLAMTVRGHRGRLHRLAHGAPAVSSRPSAPASARGPRARRGDVRAALPVLLAEERRTATGRCRRPRRAQRRWRPSPGPVYLAFCSSRTRVVRATASGDGAVEADDAGVDLCHGEGRRVGTPWEEVGGGESVGETRTLVFSVAPPSMQVVQAGTPSRPPRRPRRRGDAPVPVLDPRRRRARLRGGRRHAPRRGVVGHRAQEGV